MAPLLGIADGAITSCAATPGRIQLTRHPSHFPSQQLMALRAARSAVKTDLLLFAGGDQRFCLFPERAVAQDHCWWPVDAGEL
jgi:hypothetical protein